MPNLNEDLGIFDWVCQGGQAGSERETRPLVLDDRVVGVGGRRRNDGSVVSHGEANIRQATQWKVLILGNLLQLVNDPLGIIDNSKQKLQPIEQQRNIIM